jgi:hypothetical protein
LVGRLDIDAEVVDAPRDGVAVGMRQDDGRCGNEALMEPGAHTDRDEPDDERGAE